MESPNNWYWELHNSFRCQELTTFTLDVSLDGSSGDPPRRGMGFRGRRGSGSFAFPSSVRNFAPGVAGLWEVSPLAELPCCLSVPSRKVWLVGKNSVSGSGWVGGARDQTLAP